MWNICEISAFIWYHFSLSVTSVPFLYRSNEMDNISQCFALEGWWTDTPTLSTSFTTLWRFFGSSARLFQWMLTQKPPKFQVSCFMKNTIRSPKTSVTLCQFTRCHIPESLNIYWYRWKIENLVGFYYNNLSIYCSSKRLVNYWF
jgi:hypothetical protein